MNDIIRGKVDKKDLLREKRLVDKPGILPNGHDTGRLDKPATELQGILAEVVEYQKLIEEWFPIWRFPGWTTPAEHFFVEKNLQSLVRQTGHLRDSLKEINEGIRQVGR